MKLRVGIVNYVNALPFTLPFERGAIENEGLHFIYDTPTGLAQKLREGILGVALTSSVASFESNYRHLPRFCIAAEEEILSVNLYHKLPLPLIKEIAVTSQSATSVSLLKVLCSRVWKISPRFIPLDPTKPLETYPAFLLIGDEALKHRSIHKYARVDLAAVWFQETKLPFVFALFSYAPQLAEEKLKVLSDALEKALLWSEANLDQIVDAAHQRISLPKKILEDYFRLCRYRLGEKEQAGLECFKKLMPPNPIRAHFANIASRYDRVNSIASLGFHHLWNRNLVEAIGSRKVLLDLCSGTGEIGLGFLNRNPSAKALLLDFCPEMLEIAKSKGKEKNIEIMHADAQAIPLENECVDAVSIAYGIRNVPDTKKCFDEAFRVLQKGGIFGVLELTRPTFFLLRFLHQIYTFTFVPVLGYLVTKNKTAYSYLAKSIRSFSSAVVLEKLLQESGFHSVEKRRLLGGIATLLIGKK